MAPVIWAVDKIPGNVRSLQVIGVRVTVHTIGALVPGGQLSQNHWTIELLLSRGCVRLDMTLFNTSSTTDFRGMLKVSPLDYQLSVGHVAHFDYEVIGTRTVENFLYDITANGRHRYNMTTTGVGCRHWM